jgi:uncharacterized membrane protein YgcG
MADVDAAAVVWAPLPAAAAVAIRVVVAVVVAVVAVVVMMAVVAMTVVAAVATVMAVVTTVVAVATAVTAAALGRRIARGGEGRNRQYDRGSGGCQGSTLHSDFSCVDPERSSPWTRWAKS